MMIIRMGGFWRRLMAKIETQVDNLTRRVRSLEAAGGGGASTAASFVTHASEASLSNEKVLTAGTGISLTSGVGTLTIANTVAAGAPTDASYVALGTNASLTNERVLTAGSGISITDGGAGGNVTVACTLAAAPTDASYVTLGTNGTLTSERVLTAGSGISITDAGAGSTVTIANTQTPGDSVTVNGVACSDVDLDDATPAAPSGDLNIKFQKDSSTPPNVSGYVDVSVLEPLVNSRNLLNAPVVARKTADQTAIGTAYANVTEVGLSVTKNETYYFEFYLLCDADATTTGIDASVDGPASPTSVTYDVLLWTSTTGTVFRGGTAYNVDTTQGNSAGTAVRMYVIRGILVNGANDGTLNARVKREAVGSGPNVRKGSFGRLTKIS
jgi:hypothetical protein